MCKLKHRKNDELDKNKQGDDEYYIAVEHPHGTYWKGRVEETNNLLEDASVDLAMKNGERILRPKAGLFQGWETTPVELVLLMWLTTSAPISLPFFLFLL